jgi:cadmium resistance protein CadD (predicted permease)
MAHLLATVLTAVAVFAVTNIDDLIVLTLLFVVTRAQPGRRSWQVVVGQGIGVALLVGSAAVAALGLYAVPTGWIGLLGVFPLGFGAWKLIRDRSPASEPGAPAPEAAVPASAAAAASLAGVTAVTVVNGADNLAIYTPLFRVLRAGEVVVIIAVFAVMIGIWCAVAAWLASHLHALDVVRRHAHRLVPLVLIAIGAIILVRGTLA